MIIAFGYLRLAAVVIVLVYKYSNPYLMCVFCFHICQRSATTSYQEEEKVKMTFASTLHLTCLCR